MKILMGYTETGSRANGDDVGLYMYLQHMYTIWMKHDVGVKAEGSTVWVNRAGTEKNWKPRFLGEPQGHFRGTAKRFRDFAFFLPQ